MENHIIERTYPISFRKASAQELGKHLHSRHSVVLIGMKRVGISNFLRFFLFHKQIVSTYISRSEKHFFIPVDLNDLVEREIFPFWILTFKRILDSVEKAKLSSQTQSFIEALFLDSIQSKDLFLLIDGIRKSLVKIVEEGFLPTIFFIRFDRIKEAATPEFFANLQGLKDATHNKLAYVFTGFRSLDVLAPNAFTKSSLATFAQDMYIKPAENADTEVICQTYVTRYKLSLSKKTKDELFRLVDGYIQYLQLALIFLHEHPEHIEQVRGLSRGLIDDERIGLQSEELWESLHKKEQEVLLKKIGHEVISNDDKKTATYLWDTGFLRGEDDVFSPLFENFLKRKAKKERETTSNEFSKKEHVLFVFLERNKNEVCEREQIIEAVWPEVEALGVSDWAIDRLVARVRVKLKLQNSESEIQTVKTRGYKLIEKN